MTPVYPAGRPLFSLLEDTVVIAGQHRLTVHGRWGEIDVLDDCPMVREALRRMAFGPVALENIPVLLAEFHEWQATGVCGTQWPRMKRTLDQLGGCVVPSLALHDGAGPILSLVPVRSDAAFRWPQIDDDEPVSMAAGVRLERAGDEDVLINPALSYRVVLHRPHVTEVIKLLLPGPTTVNDLARRLQIGPERAADIVAYLASGGFVTAAGVGR
ncbi:hypothetical protein [Pseudonocardia sp. TRM90224]|uniref:hypothetical protein n=1 Tax=Pseudonocardia sp. TRM90224 TaxID=2812678 RepID=UPI001E2F86C1|nr:hypothetical protein [Pseudonocardia sp. TRM90224]